MVLHYFEREIIERQNGEGTKDNRQVSEQVKQRNAADALYPPNEIKAERWICKGNVRIVIRGVLRRDKMIRLQITRHLQKQTAIVHRSLRGHRRSKADDPAEQQGGHQQQTRKLILILHGWILS